ncbi:hypothetical protein [Buttiauxella sp. B2]|uniref:hypothetical protein n=1 Tax=Buttiauxella sp. B2 TaxID=2587812 RepID=UPI001679AF41|nr:hypothetical protein [Buttiauxella sp. B2]
MTEQVIKAEFNSEEAVKLPVGFRHWIHVGAFIKEKDIDIFDNRKITAPLIGNSFFE